MRGLDPTGLLRAFATIPQMAKQGAAKLAEKCDAHRRWHLDQAQSPIDKPMIDRKYWVLGG
jgi:hypothetical protein